MQTLRLFFIVKKERREFDISFENIVTDLMEMLIVQNILLQGNVFTSREI